MKEGHVSTTCLVSSLSEWVNFLLFLHCLVSGEANGGMVLDGLRGVWWESNISVSQHEVLSQLRPLWNCSVATQEVFSEWCTSLNWVCTLPVLRTRNVTNTIHHCCKPLLSHTSARDIQQLYMRRHSCPMIFHPLDGRSVNTDVATTEPSNPATQRCSTQLLGLQL